MIGNNCPSSLECLGEVEPIQLSQRPSATTGTIFPLASDPFRHGREHMRPSVCENAMLLRNDR
jgi:hypothetical protein